MSKQIKKLEKETAQWRSKWETSQRELIHLSQEVLHTVLIKKKIFLKHFMIDL
jgi:hypothetical protein